MNTALLEEIGLTKAEIKVYLALLELGSSTTGPIVEKSAASSSKIYEILDKLTSKGLVTHVIEANTKYFEAVSPERLIDYLVEKQKDLEKKRDELKMLMPELKLKHTLAQHKKDAKIFRGVKGMESAFNEGLKELMKGDQLLVLGVSSHSEASNRFFLKLNRETAARGIRTRLLFDETAKGEPQTDQRNHPNGEFKFLPKGVLTPASISIFKESIIIFPAEKGEEPLLIMIKGNDVADSFRAQFTMLWDQDVKVFRGMSGLDSAFAEAIAELRRGESYEVIGIPSRSAAVNDFFIGFNAKIAERGIRVKSIFDETARGDPQTRLKNIPSGEIKFLPRGVLTPAAINIFKESTIIFPYEGGAEPRLIMIKGKEVADSFRAQFNLIWNQQAVVITGPDGPRKVMLGILEAGGNNVAMGIQHKHYLEEIPDTMKHFFAMYAHKGFKGRILVKEGDIIRARTKGNKRGEHPWGEEIRYLPQEFISPLAIEVYGSTLALIDWTEPITTIFIEKREIAKGFIKYFDALWKIAKS